MIYSDKLTALRRSAETAIKLLGASPENWIAVAAQWVLEKGYLYWEELQSNPQNVTDYNVGNNKEYENGNLIFAKPPDLQAGIELYVHSLLHDPEEYYVGVLHALRSETPEIVLVALHHSPYCDPPYSLQTLNAVLGHLEIEFGLVQVDTPASKPEESKEAGEYVTVEPGDTLWKFAGNRWPNLLYINPGLNPYRLVVGQRIRIK